MKINLLRLLFRYSPLLIKFSIRIIVPKKIQKENGTSFIKPEANFKKIGLKTIKDNNKIVDFLFKK